VLDEQLLARIKKDIPKPYFDYTRFEPSAVGPLGVMEIDIERKRVVKGIWVHTIQYSYDAAAPAVLNTITDAGATSRFVLNVQAPGMDSFNPHYFIYSNRINFVASAAIVAFTIGYCQIFSMSNDLDPE